MTRRQYPLLAFAAAEVVYPLGLILGLGPTIPRHLILFFVAFACYLAAVLLLLRGDALNGTRPIGSRVAGQADHGRAVRASWSWSEAARDRALIAGLAIAIILRLLMLGSFPSLSDDLYRYIWDGKVANEGINPYTYAPSATELEPLRSPLWTPINAKDLHTPYPPLAQALFAGTFLLAGEQVKAQQVVAVLGDLAAIVALLVLLQTLRRPPVTVLIYALNPLTLMHLAHSAHNDGWMIALLLLAVAQAHRRAPSASAASIAAAILVKFFAGVAIPAIAGGWRVRHALLTAAVVILGFAPFYVSANPLRGILFEAGEARFNDSLYWVAERALSVAIADSADVVTMILAGMLLVVAGAVWGLARRGLPPADGAFVMVGSLLLILPVVEPWYALWVLPFVALFLQRPRDLWSTATGGWLLFTGLVALTELTYAYSASIWPLVRLSEYGPLYFLLIWSAARHVRSWRSCGSFREIAVQ